MQYDGYLRFKTITRQRFFDRPSMVFVVGISTIVVFQMTLMLAGKPKLLSLLHCVVDWPTSHT